MKIIQNNKNYTHASYKMITDHHSLEKKKSVFTNKNQFFHNTDGMVKTWN